MEDRAASTLRRLGEALRTALRWLGRHELGVNVAVFALALGVSVFMKVESEIREGDTAALDRAVLLSLRNPTDMSAVESLGAPCTSLPQSLAQRFSSLC